MSSRACGFGGEACVFGRAAHRVENVERMERRAERRLPAGFVVGVYEQI